MLGNILEINGNIVTIKLAIDINSQTSLINLHIVFEDGPTRIVGVINNVTQTQMTSTIVGEFINDKFSSGMTSKPSFKSQIRIIKLPELEEMLGKQEATKDEFYFGLSNVYQNYKINVNINDFFSNHFAVLGNSGSGKSCTVASIIQHLFSSPNPPLKSSIFFFDAFGEYTRAFSNLHNVNPALNYKTYTTNTKFAETEIVNIPVWLLDVDDLALLLDVTTPMQLPIIEKTLKLVPILTGSSPEVIKRKNYIKIPKKEKK